MSFISNWSQFRLDRQLLEAASGAASGAAAGTGTEAGTGTGTEINTDTGQKRKREGQQSPPPSATAPAPPVAITSSRRGEGEGDDLQKGPSPPRGPPAALACFVCIFPRGDIKLVSARHGVRLLIRGAYDI
jgi:hypothetical protein